MNVRFNHTSCKYHISTLKMSDKVTDKETIQVGLRKYKGTSVFSSCEVEKIPEMTIIEDDVWILTFPRSAWKNRSRLVSSRHIYTAIYFPPIYFAANDMKAAIRSIADHLGVEVTDDDVDKINDHCTFRSMKENESTNAIWMRDCTNVDQSFGGHVRKGKVGGWREHLTPEMSGKIDSMVHEKLGHLDINFDYGE
ncbi:ST1E1-like protein [Mya arenaria]|uniref:ST1E1-like protein n=1 Tax=Mya arenaria TaxID=6604 RepID=A0ABY7FK19_MYAAR|nr:ST1E1-like protein [Mya arenaria]